MARLITLVTLVVLAQIATARADGENLARSDRPLLVSAGKPTRQSSVAAGGISARAVDGNLDGAWASGSTTHTAGEAGAWFEIDLGTPTLVDNVVLYNRTDCCVDRLNRVRVELSTTPCDASPRGTVGTNAIGIAPRISVLPFRTAPVARYVCVVQDAAVPLSLAEVQVFARVNLALGAPVRQSSLAANGLAQRATDGNADGRFNAASVTHTNPGPNQWLEIDLGSEQLVGTVAVANRTDCCSARLAGVRVEISKVRCDFAIPAGYHAPYQYALPFGTLTAEPLTRLDSPITTYPARYVCLRQDRGEPLSVAEVSVFAPGRDHLPAHARSSSSGYGAGADRANDGDTTTTWAGASMFNSSVAPDGTPNDSAPWLEVDLGQPTPIGDVVVYNRTDCCNERLAEARVELSLDPCDQPTRRVLRDEVIPSPGRVKGKHPLTGKPILISPGTVPARTQFDFIEAPRARYVCVRHDRRQFLTVAEVEVHAGVAAENLARRGTATQSTTLFDAQPERAIDGWTDGTWGTGSVTHTEGKAGQWWQVDLGREQIVRALAVWNRTDCCDERLTSATVELTRNECAKGPADRGTVKTATLVPRPLDTKVPRRSQFNFPDHPTARYACVFNSGANPLSLAEVEVFGLGSATAEEVPLPIVKATAASDADAARARYAPPTTSEAQVGASSIDITVSYGGVTLPTCQLVVTGTEKYAMTCPGLPEIAMTGKLVSSTQYDLQSAQPISITTVAGTLFPSLGRHLEAIAPLFASTSVYLALTNTRGFHLRGTLDLASLPASPLTDAFATANGFLASNVPGYLKAPAFELIPSLSNQALGVILRLTVVDNKSCAVKPLALAGTGLKYGKSTLVFFVGIGGGGPMVSVGFESTAYLKPTPNDAWLQIFPGVELDAGVGGAVTFKGRVGGACSASCVATCSCSNVECEAEWNPLGLKTVTLKQGYIELGVATTGVALPVVTMAFDHAKLGNTSNAVEGTYAVSLDLGPSKAFGFQLAANRMPVLPFLALIGLGNVLPSDLAIKNPVLSFSTTGLALFNVTVPAGFRLKGGVDLGIVKGSLDASIGSNITDLSKLGTSVNSLVAFGMPSGSLRFRLEIADLPSMILHSGTLSMLARPILERTFWLSSVDLELGIGGNASVGGKVNFKLLGSSHSFGVSASVALDPVTLAETIAKAAKDLIIDPISGAVVAAYTAVKAAAEKAAAETAAALATGATVVVNGVVTVGSKIVSTVADADNYKKIYNWIPGL